MVANRIFFNRQACFFKNFPFGTILYGFIELKVSAGKGPCTRTVGTFRFQSNTFSFLMTMAATPTAGLFFIYFSIIVLSMTFSVFYLRYLLFSLL